MRIEPKAYKLINKIQDYDWGTKNDNAFIPKLIGCKVVEDKPYAELWIGAHPKAPSEIIVENNKCNLNEVIEQFPIEILGKYVAEKFNNKLPFLLKVLSAARALSIQTHPNKMQAEILHKKDPSNYPDDNHKPEIAIAIDGLTAIAGFRPVGEIRDILKRNSQLRTFVGISIYDDVINENENNLENNIKLLYKNIMHKAGDKEKLKVLIDKLILKITKKVTLEPEEKQFVEQHKLYGYDVGLLSFFLFNLIELKPRQAIYTDAGIPHAYIQGNIIECMANSDNVVRAGLTNKFKDIDVLIDILKYDFEHYNIINREQNSGEVSYKTTAEEFEITILSKPKHFESEFITNNKLEVYLILDGSVEIKYGKKLKSEIFNKGESILIPAILKSYILHTKEESEFVRVVVPSESGE